MSQFLFLSIRACLYFYSRWDLPYATFYSILHLRFYSFAHFTLLCPLFVSVTLRDLRMPKAYKAFSGGRGGHSILLTPEPYLNMTTALIIIDLQKEFCSPLGILREKHIDDNKILESVKFLVGSRKWDVLIWIKSVYDNKPKFDQNGGRLTHFGGKQCCVDGTELAEFIDGLPIDKEEHFIIVKNYYDAFVNTNLDHILKEKNIENVHVAGLTANTCVKHTCKTAYNLGYTVIPEYDCIFAVSKHLKDESLDDIYNHICAKNKTSMDMDFLIPENVEEEIKTACAQSMEKPELDDDWLIDIELEEVTKDRENKKVDKMDDTSIYNEWHGELTTPGVKKCTKPILYIVNGSIPSWRVQMALHLVDIDYTPKRLKVMTTPKETRSAEFMKINPRGKTPTLIDRRGNIISESMAIINYILIHDRDLKPYGINFHHRGVKIIQRMYESDILQNCYENMELVFEDVQENKKLIRKAYDDVLSELNFWEKYAGEDKYIAGNSISMADCTFYPTLAYIVHRGCTLSDYPNLERYYNIMFDLPSAVASHPVGWGKNAGGKNVFNIAKKLASSP